MKCNCCGEHFDEPYVYRESHGFTDGLTEKWSVCPFCGSPDIDDTTTTTTDEEEDD